MAVIYDSVEPLDPAGSMARWRFHSDRTPPVTLRLFGDGLLIDEIVSADGSGEARISSELDFEVLDKDAAVPRPAYPGRNTLYWTQIAGAKYYRVDEFVSAVWTERAKVFDFGQGHFTWLTGLLDPLSQYQFRVVPVLDGDLEAAAIPFTFTPVRRPPPPEVTFSYSAGTGKVTINAI